MLMGRGISFWQIHVVSNMLWTYMSHDRRKLQVFAVSTRSDTNRAVQPQKMARGLKFRIRK